MATALQRQLAVIAANSTHQLDLKAQKAAHGKSLLFDAKVAASQDFNTIYRICSEGYEDLCSLDERFNCFGKSIFSEQSKSEERGLMTADENKELDVVLERFLVLISGRLLLKPAQKAVEWLIRRFHVHEHNAEYLIMAFLPYHSTQLFLSLLSILPKQIPHAFRFLYPSISTMQNPPFHTVLHTATTNSAFFAAYNNFVLRACRDRCQAPAVMSFWASLSTQAVDGMMSAAQSGRDTIHKQKQEDLMLRVLPMLNEALSPKLADVNELVVAACMIITVLGAKGHLDDHVLDTLMEAVLTKVTPATSEARLTCLSFLAENRESLELSKVVSRKLLKIQSIIELLALNAPKLPVGRLILGLILRDLRSRARNDGNLSLQGLNQLLRCGALTDSQQRVLCERVVAIVKDADDGVPPIAQRGALSAVVEYLSETSQSQSKFQDVLDDIQVDQDTIERALQTTLRITKGTMTDVREDEIMSDAPPGDDDSDGTLATLGEHKLRAPSFLALDASEDYLLFKAAFTKALASEAQLKNLLQVKPLSARGSVFNVPVATLLLRLSADSSLGQSARATALRCLQTLLQAKIEDSTLLQFVLPYLIASLADQSGSVRRTAAECVLAIGKWYKADEKHIGKSEDGIDHQLYHWQNLTNDEMKHLINDLLVSNLEEARLDANNVTLSLAKQLRYNNQSKKSKKTKASEGTTIYDYLASHAAETTLANVKLVLLKILNGCGSISLQARERFLSPVLTQSLVVPFRVTVDDQLNQDNLRAVELELFRTITDDSNIGLNLLTDIIAARISNVRREMLRAALIRLSEIWNSLSSEQCEKLAGLLMDAALRTLETTDRDLYYELASETIRNLELPSQVLNSLVINLPNALNMPDAPPATKRRRTSRSEKARLAAVEPADLSAALAKYTLVLELLESNKPADHPELLHGLFKVLEELQNFRLQTQSGLVYLEGLTISCLLAIVDKLKSDKSSAPDTTTVRTDLIVDCIRHSTSAQVQSSALLLISSLASWQPDTVVHSIMPIFTFMGNTILRQGDEFSVHVTEKTVSQVVPPLVESFRKKNKDIVVGASSLLLSFTAAFEHIPLHRRLALFEHVARTVGPEESLYALIAMLIDAYPTDARAKKFVAELLNKFEPSVGLKTVRKCLDLVWDMFRSRRTISNHVLNMSERPKDTHDNIANHLLTAFAELLNDKELRSQMSKSFESGYIDSANAQRMACVELIQEAIRLSQFLKSKPDLAQPAAAVLSSVVNLLPTIELVQCSETLLAQKDEEVRLTAIGSVLNRAKEVSNPSSDDVMSLLAYMSKLTALLSGSDNTALSVQAITCAGQIIKRFGKKDTEVVISAAQIIAGQHALGHADRQVQLASVVCLTVAIKALKDEFIPLVPAVLPSVYKYLEQGVSDNTGAEQHKTIPLSTSCFAFVNTLVECLPFLVTGESLDTALRLSAAAAVPDVVSSKLKDSRSALYRLLAKIIDADEMFVAFERNFKGVLELESFEAVVEFFGAVRLAITSRSKSVIIRNASSLFELFLQAFDHRRQSTHRNQTQNTSDAEDDGIDEEELDRLQYIYIEVALVMVMKINDATFRPFIVRLSEWATQLPKKDVAGKMMRATSLFNFLALLFGKLKSLVTSYATYVLDLAAEVLDTTALDSEDGPDLLEATLSALEESFKHDDEQFWQSPHHFTPIATPLVALIEKSTLADEQELAAKTQSAIVSMATATNAQEQHKLVNTALLKMLRHENAKVRLAAVKTERELCEKMGDEWLGMLPEMLPFVSELLEDDDKDVERAGREWVRFLEGILGENLEL